MQLIITNSFKDSVEQRAPKAILNLISQCGYTPLAKTIALATTEVSFMSKKYNKTVTNRVITIESYTYAIGFVVDGDAVVVKNFLNAEQVASHKKQKSGSGITRKTVKPFNLD